MVLRQTQRKIKLAKAEFLGLIRKWLMVKTVKKIIRV